MFSQRFIILVAFAALVCPSLGAIPVNKKLRASTSAICTTATSPPDLPVATVLHKEFLLYCPGDPLTFEEAKNYCDQLSTDPLKPTPIARIISQDEKEAIAAMMTGDYWVGFKDPTDQNVWQYTAGGEPAGYLNGNFDDVTVWAEPPAVDNDKMCTGMIPENQGSFREQSCDGKEMGVVCYRCLDGWTGIDCQIEIVSPDE